MIRLLKRTEWNKRMSNLGLKATEPGPLKTDQGFFCWREDCAGFVICYCLECQLAYYKKLITHFQSKKVFFSVNEFFDRRARMHKKDIFTLQKRIGREERFKKTKKMFGTSDIFSMCGYCTGKDISTASAELIEHTDHLNLCFEEKPIHIYQCHDGEFHVFTKGKKLALECARLGAGLNLQAFIPFTDYEREEITSDNYKKFVAYPYHCDEEGHPLGWLF